MNELKELISEISGESIGNIHNKDQLIENLDFDSLMIIDLVQGIEEKFNLKSNSIKLQDIKKDITVEKIWDLICKINKNEIIQNYSLKVTNIDNFPEVENFNKYYEDRKETQPYFKKDQSIPKNHIILNNQEYINYSTYNYLGLNGDKRVSAYAKNAIDKYGTSVSSSRLLSGEIPLHHQLEKEISEILGTEDAIVQVGGHSTNVNTIGNIVDDKDLVIHDEFAHNSIIQGIKLAHAMRRSFKHNDMNSLEKILSRLRSKYRRTLIIAEGIYSMDGDICKLPELVSIKKKYGCILMIDEAHSFGTIGAHGGGVCDYYNLSPKNIDILMGTLSKSCGSCGGYIAGSLKFINWLRFNSPGFVFSAGITPPNTASALAAIRIFRKEPERIEKLQLNSKKLLNDIKYLGYNTGTSNNTQIIPIITGDSKKANRISQKLARNKINAMPIVYPAVKEDEARIRFFVTSLHTKADIEKTLRILKQIKEEDVEI